MEALSSQSSIASVSDKQPSGDTFRFSIIFSITFLADSYTHLTLTTSVLLIAVLSTCLRLPWRSWLPGAEGSSSLLSDVRSAVYTLMSHLT